MKLPRLIELRKPLTVLAVTVSGMRIIAQAQDEDSTELAKELANPIASLISVPFQNNVDLGIGPNEEGWRYTLNIQPVIPISLTVLGISSSARSSPMSTRTMCLRQTRP